MRDKPVDAFIDVPSDRGSIPLASTIILGQKRCHAVKAAWHQHFKGGNDPCFLLFKIKDEIGFFR